MKPFSTKSTEASAVSGVSSKSKQSKTTRLKFGNKSSFVQTNSKQMNKSYSALIANES